MLLKETKKQTFLFVVCSTSGESLPLNVDKSCQNKSGWRHNTCICKLGQTIGDDEMEI
jgi:hypothetical protein